MRLSFGHLLTDDVVVLHAFGETVFALLKIRVAGLLIKIGLSLLKQCWTTGIFGVVVVQQIVFVVCTVVGRGGFWSGSKTQMAVL